MKSLVITPKNENEFKFLSSLLKKLGIGTSTLSKEQLEDIGISKLMSEVDKSKKATRSEIFKKLTT